MGGMKVPTIAIDFDGVCNTYEGWEGKDVEYPPAPGVEAFFTSLRAQGWEIIIFTCRPKLIVRKWFKRYNLTRLIAGVTNKKPIATIYLDDRGLQFHGHFDETLMAIKEYTVHWQEMT
jgi:hypothetical protein